MLRHPSHHLLTPISDSSASPTTQFFLNCFVVNYHLFIYLLCHCLMHCTGEIPMPHFVMRTSIRNSETRPPQSRSFWTNCSLMVPELNSCVRSLKSMRFDLNSFFKMFLLHNSMIYELSTPSSFAIFIKMHLSMNDTYGEKNFIFIF